jgi:mRNA-degrading endonuclease toxin of MazEF toxin-antitoxin module
VVERGDVLKLRRRLGFAASGKVERFVVVQDARLNAFLPTVLVIPLDDPLAVHERNPAAVSISAAEAGTAGRQVALVTHLTVLPVDRFEASIGGRLSQATLSQIDAVLKIVLGLD